MIIFVLLVISFTMLYPLYFTIIASLSDPTETHLGNTFFFIKGFTLEAYHNVFINDGIWTGYLNSIFITAVGTITALVITIPAAYVLSRNQFKGRNALMIFFMITMFFSGGLIPSYLVMQSLGLVNTYAVLILGSGFSVFNMIIARTFYQSNFPTEVYEAAKIDGCSELGIFVKMALPLSGAIIAVIGLYVAVGHWNSYFGALIYLSDKDKWPLQIVLRNILIMNQQMTIDPASLQAASEDELALMARRTRMAESMKYSLIFIASLPMLIAYPFVQKYFVKGVLIGSIKG